MILLIEKFFCLECFFKILRKMCFAEKTTKFDDLSVRRVLQRSTQCDVMMYCTCMLFECLF
jgi:hypothetical protein